MTSRTKISIKILFLLAVFLLLMIQSPESKAEGEKALTLMVYMTGSDLETMNGSASADLQEMLDSGFDDSRISVLVMTGGAEYWHMGFDSSILTILELGTRGKRVVESIPGASMGDPATLTSFLRFGMEYSPAREYALILWNHGGGPLEGVCFDELYSRDSLSMTELKQALEGSTFGPENQLAWIGFDACMMASVETANTCFQYARYMIASQETEPATGWNYAFLKDLGDRTDGAEAARSIAEAYMQTDGSKPLTLSCLDLSVTEYITAALSGLYTKVDRNLTAESFSAISNDRRDTKGFGRLNTLSDYDLVDLYHLSEQYALLAPEEAEKLRRRLEQAVVYNTGNQENAHGLSAYLPYYNKNDFTGHWLEEYKRLELPLSFVSHMNHFAYYWLGSQLADWSGLAGSAEPAGEDGIQRLELKLTEEQQKHFASARVVILRNQGLDDAFFEVFEIPELKAENGVIRAEYDYSGLFVTDDRGNILSDMYPFMYRDGRYLLVAQLEKSSIHDTAYTGVPQPEEDTRLVYFSCVSDPETGEMTVAEVIDFEGMASEDGNLSGGKQYITADPGKWPYIYFNANNFAFFRTRDTDGRILPYNQWHTDYVSIRNMTVLDENNQIIPESEWQREAARQTGNEMHYRLFSEVDNTKPWSIHFLKGHYGTQDLYAQFIITDTQGIESATELIPLQNPAVRDSQRFDRELYRDEQAAFTLEAIDVVSSDVESGLRFRFLLETSVQEELSFQLLDPVLNHTVIDNSHQASELHLMPGEVFHISVMIHAEDIPYLDSTELTSAEFEAALWKSRDAQSYAVGSGRFCLETSLDLEPLHIPETNTARVWAVSNWEKTEYRLLDLSIRKNGGIRGVLHVKNKGEEIHHVGFQLTDQERFGVVMLNGCLLPDALQASSGFVSVPGGYETNIPFSLSRLVHLNAVNDDYNSVFEAYDAFSYWGLEQMEQLDLLINTGGEALQMCFSLIEPFPLESEPDSSFPEPVPFLNGKLVRISLRSVEWTDHHPRIFMDVQGFSDNRTVLQVTDCQLNGKPVQALFSSEAHLFDADKRTNAYSFQQQDGTHRIAADLIPEKTEEGEALESITFRFRIAEIPYAYHYDFQVPWQYSDYAAITPRAEETEPDTPLLSGVLSVTEGTFPPDLDLKPLLGGAPTWPEEWQEQVVYPALQLTDEQSEAVSSAWVALLTPCGVEGYEDCYYLTASITDAYKTENNLLYVPFYGMLAAGAGADCPMFQQIDVIGNHLRFLVQSLYLADGENHLLYDIPQAIVTFDGKETDVYTVQYTETADASHTEEWKVWVNQLNTFRLNPDENHCIPGSQQWEYLTLVDEVIERQTERPMLEIRSAGDMDLQVVFLIRNKDGSEYGVMLPLRECAVSGK